MLKKAGKGLEKRTVGFLPVSDVFCMNKGIWIEICHGCLHESVCPLGNLAKNNGGNTVFWRLVMDGCFILTGRNGSVTRGKPGSGIMWGIVVK